MSTSLESESSSFYSWEMALNVNLDVTFLIADDWKGI
jgi:hypothetical protein